MRKSRLHFLTSLSKNARCLVVVRTFGAAQAGGRWAEARPFDVFVVQVFIETPASKKKHEAAPGTAMQAH